jgi:hypothetical protein
MARLKVFAAPMGFYETVVAAPSKKAALAAWGVSQDLFAAGEARLAEDPQAEKAALAHPGVVLRRPAGEKGPWLEAANPPTAPRSAARRSKVKPADRSPLDAAEKAQAREAAAFEKKRQDLERRSAALEAELEELEREHAERAAAAARRLDEARAAFVAAGGKP